jgi:hypothetical protein
MRVSNKSSLATSVLALALIAGLSPAHAGLLGGGGGSFGAGLAGGVGVGGQVGGDLRGVGEVQRRASNTAHQAEAKTAATADAAKERAKEAKDGARESAAQTRGAAGSMAADVRGQTQGVLQRGASAGAAAEGGVRARRRLTQRRV